MGGDDPDRHRIDLETDNQRATRFPAGVVDAVDTDAAMNVVGGDAQALQARHPAAVSEDARTSWL